MMDEEGKSAQQIIAEAIALRQALKEGNLVEVSNTPQTDYTDDSFNDEFLQKVNSKDSFDKEASIVEVDYSPDSDNIICNPNTFQQTIGLLSSKQLRSKDTEL